MYELYVHPLILVLFFFFISTFYNNCYIFFGGGFVFFSSSSILLYFSSSFRLSPSSLFTFPPFFPVLISHSFHHIPVFFCFCFPSLRSDIAPSFRLTLLLSFCFGGIPSLLLSIIPPPPIDPFVPLALSSFSVPLDPSRFPALFLFGVQSPHFSLSPSQCSDLGRKSCPWSRHRPV